MKRKIVSVLLAGTMLLGSSSALAYNDTSGHWAEIYIDNMLEAGALEQFTEENIQPDKPITRGECTELISDFLELYCNYEPPYLENSYVFSDLKDGTNQTKKIRALRKHRYKSVMTSEFRPNHTLIESSIINGYYDDTFKPDNNITRAEFSKILVNSLDCFGYLGVFNSPQHEADYFVYSDDGELWQHWGSRYLNIAYGINVLNGYNKTILDDGIPYIEFRPDNNITRAEAIKMVASARKMQYIGLEDHSTRVEGEAELYYLSEY